MGKKRIKLIDTAAEEEKPKKPRPKKQVPEETVELEPEKKIEEDEKVEKKEKAKPKKARIRSRRYQELKKQVDRTKNYLPEEAVKLLLKLAKARFDETVELNLNLRKDQVSGSVKLPHGTGKKQKIAVFNSRVETQIKAGKLDFDLLVAKPTDMVKIAQYAKTLGPKGLMPNPKAGTISEKPEELIKKLQQEVHFKSEKKAPLIHAIIGKVSFGEKKLLENLEAFLTAIGKQQITKAVLASSIGPGIKIEV